ncbi:hypothetical protein H5410_025022 [Solanum commersonii]|uniref:Uncharacterized protein n=1 Tax=Solanum commersonii TaxID=4109 RepID=A0A9J5YT24_SOLCO|nr:hypothetical protein H5410_025022 [Solanum commersonii]
MMMMTEAMGAKNEDDLLDRVFSLIVELGIFGAILEPEEEENKAAFMVISELFYRQNKETE